MERHKIIDKKIFTLVMAAAMSLAFLVTVMTSPASARPVSNITIVNKTGGPIYNLKHLVADDVKDVFFAGKLDNGAELHDFSNYDEWVFLWGTDASGKEICFCAEKEVSNGATVELYGAYNVKVSY